MDTDLLKTFLEVSRTKHFSRAAESLYLTQAAISFRIRQLENHLGVTLFTRQRNNINLTTAGKKLLPFAEKIMTTWQEACQQVLHKEQVEICIGAPHTLWETALFPWIQQVCQQAPTLKITTRTDNRTILLKQLYQNELDLLFTTEACKTDELQSSIIGKFSLARFRARKTAQQKTPPYIHVEWHQDLFHAEKNSSLLSTPSAQLAMQLLSTTGGYAFLPVQWCNDTSELEIDKNYPQIECSIHAVWSRSSYQQDLIVKLLSQPIV